MFAAMPPLEAKKALFAYVAGVREKRREEGQHEVKFVLIEVNEAHFTEKCDEEEWVELPDEFKKFGKVCQAEEMVTWHESVRMGG